MSYVDEIYERVVAKNPGEADFHQEVKEVLDSLKLVIDANEAEYRKISLLERLVEPERIISFKVPWVDDNGVIQVNKAYRVQFNSAIGPYKGGMRFHPSVNQSILSRFSRTHLPAFQSAVVRVVPTSILRASQTERLWHSARAL